MAFSQETIRNVWEKAKVIENNDKNVFRKDECSAWIKRSEYGNRESKFGWEIDHIKPESKGGTDDISNLRPLHWKNNAAKSDGKLNCVVQSEGTNNKGI